MHDKNTSAIAKAGVGLGLLALLNERNNVGAQQQLQIPSFLGAPNLVLATPTGGGAGYASLRALVAADIPALPASIIASGVLTRSVGGLGVSSASVNANQFYGGPTSGGPAAGAFRALVSADVPNLDASVITSGILGLARGGLGVNASSVGQALFFGGPAGSTGAPTLRALQRSDIPGIQQNIASAAKPFIDILGADLVTAQPFQVWDAPNATKWRFYLDQNFWLLCRNCTTGDGITFTREVNGEFAVVHYYGYDGLYKIACDTTASATFTLSTVETFTRLDPKFGALPFVKNRSAQPINLWAGGYVKAAAAGNVIKIPFNFGVVFESAPTALSVVSTAYNVNVSGTPTITDVTVWGAVINITALATGDVNCVARVQVSS